MEVIESPLCSLCQKDNETFEHLFVDLFEHLFVDCTFSKKLWTDIDQSMSPQLTLPKVNAKIVPWDL